MAIPKQFVFVSILIILLAACSPEAIPLAPTATVPNTQIPTTLPPPSPTTTSQSTDAPALTPTAGTTIQPLTMEVCDGQAQAMEHALNIMTVTQSEAPIYDLITGTSGMGCMSTVTGTGAQFKAPDVVVNTLGSMLKDEGWTEDPMLAAGGPTGFGAGYRKGNQISIVGAIWFPDASANCPKDQPISACQVKPEQQNYTITMNYGIENP